MRRVAALLLACIATGAVAAEAPPPPLPPIYIPPPPPAPRPAPPPPVVVPAPSPRQPNLMDELRAERDLRETERHLDLLEDRRRRGQLDPAEARELQRLQENARRLRGR